MTLRRRFARVVLSGDNSSVGKRNPASGPQRRQGGTTGKMRRAKPPNVIGRGPLLAEPGFEVAIVCIVKDEAAYLEEWLAYHFALGIGHVFIYDNGSTDGSAELVQTYQNHGLVTVIDWPLGGGQLAAYNHALRLFGAAARWLAFYDVDEFLVPVVDDDIPTFLARFTDAADVRVPRKEFGFSGHREPPQGLTIDAYTQVANVLALDSNLPPRVKSIVQPATISAVDVHLAFPADELQPGAPSETAEVSVRGVAQLNHYYTRSFDEFEAKRFRGSATGRIARAAVPFDIATIETDTAAQQYSDRTRQMIDRLRSLEPRPYYYGSQLGLGFFPRPDDLGRFAEFAVANTAAGLDEPKRVAASKVKNLYGGVGLVGDLTDTGYRPHAGDLAASIHTAVLVEHMRGRIDVGLTDGSGAISSPDGQLAPDGEGPIVVANPASSTDLTITMPPSEMLRCHALGLVLSSIEPLRLEVRLHRLDRSASEVVALELPASACLAGIVEIDPSPQHAARLQLTIESDAPSVELYDLFVVSYG